MIWKGTKSRRTAACAVAACLGALLQQSASGQMASAGLAGHRLQQIALTTADLPRAIAFYRDVLGLPFLFESNGMAFFDIAGMRLMIALDRDRPSARPTSIHYFEVTALDETLARMEALGVHFDGPVETVSSATTGTLRFRQFTDPDGNALAVMSMPED